MTSALTRALVGATALGAILSAPAFAADTTKLAAADAREPESVIVFGKTQSRQVQTLKAVDIEKAAPGTSPLLVLNKLPGVNFQAANSFGAYEWSTRITLRGFNQNQLGFTLDDVPLGDMSYGNFNGLHISRAIISENIARSALSQGTGALETASTNNLGGTIQFFSADPSDERGGVLAQGFGSDAARRTYVKLESGLLSTGTKFYASFVDQNSEKWRGAGEQRQQQVDFKLNQAFGANTTLSVFVHHSDREEIDYQDMSYEMISKLGWKWDNYYPNWTAALNAAKGIFTRGEDKIIIDNNDPLDAAYYAGSGLRTDTIVGGALDTQITDMIRWKTTVYHHTNDGRGLWYTPYTASPNGTPVSVRTTEYAIDRTGVISALTVNLGAHKINGGLWYENNDFNQARRFYANTVAAPLDPYSFPSNPFFTQWQYDYKTDTVQVHLQDTYTVTDALTVNLGFKSPSVETNATTLVGTVKNGKLKADKSFLPQAGAIYALSGDSELYVNYAQNMRAFQASNTGVTPFAVGSQAVFDAIKGTVKPETSDTYEGGWRFRTDRLEAQVTGYHIDFNNRLLGITQGVGILGNQPVIANVGKVTTDGAEVGGTLRITPDLRWLNSVSYNNSTYGNDYANGSTVVRIRGKQVVDAPKILFKSELGYDDGVWFGQVATNYFSKRFVTYSNDVRAGAYAIVNAGLGYRLTLSRYVKEVTFQLNVNNVLDRRYIATIGSNGIIVSDPLQTFNTLLPGAPRSVFFNVTARF